jgi:hypothetical protein
MRFYNSGKFTHQIGRHKETGDVIEHIKDLAPKGHDIGTAIVNFPGSKFHKAVKAGEWVDCPDELTEDMVKNACPSLLTESEAAPIIAAASAAAKPAVKGKE